MGRIPLIAVLLDKVQQVGNPFRHTSITATLQHGGLQVQTVDHEIRVSQSTKIYSQFNFHVAIARTNAGKPQKGRRLITRLTCFPPRLALVVFL
jgi:hypothetical protein